MKRFANIKSKSYPPNDNGLTTLITNGNGKIRQSKDKSSANLEAGRCVDDIADWLVDEFKSPGSRKFYCLVSWQLSRPMIERLVATAKADGKHPARLFNHLARRYIRDIKRPGGDE